MIAQAAHAPPEWAGFVLESEDVRAGDDRFDVVAIRYRVSCGGAARAIRVLRHEMLNAPNAPQLVVDRIDEAIESIWSTWMAL